MKEENQKQKVYPRTYLLEQESLDLLNETSELSGIAMGRLVNQALKDYLPRVKEAHSNIKYL